MDNVTGVLLVNLGTPISPKPKDVYRYLIEFLTDERVIDIPWLRRQLLVRGLIVPFRYRKSSLAYQKIWTPEGSPLMVYGKRVKEALRADLGAQFKVELAMRYQYPSIKEGIAALMDAQVRHLIVLPLFPQYASATTGSVHQRVMEEIKHYPVIPKLTLLNHYATHPALIEAFCANARTYPLHEYDHILFSFHGLPERHVRKSDKNNWCLKADCCSQLCQSNQDCYVAQCYSTARSIAQGLRLASKEYTICFQSRLGKDPWLKPYTSEKIAEMASKGKKKVLVFCPSFVCDCLETIFEIGVEYAEEFKHAGGERLDLVPGLNDRPVWIKALQQIVLENA